MFLATYSLVAVGFGRFLAMLGPYLHMSILLAIFCAPIIVAATLGFGAVIIGESALSFLGFGIMPPVPTWGNMLNEARNSPLEYLFVQALSPGLCIFVTVLSINFIGDGLRDALDPRLKM